MKGKILIVLMALIMAVPSFAQKNQDGKNKEERRKEMMEFKLKFLADEIELKEEQKKEFNAIYTQMEQERRVVFKKMKNAEKLIKENKNASESDYEKATNDIAAAKTEMSQIEKKYDQKLAAFLTKKQMYKLKEAETKFMETMRKCKDKKEGKNNK